MPAPSDSSSGQPEERPGDTAPPRMPRWVKTFAAVVAGLILLAVILQVTGIAGEHGPGRHGSQGTGKLAWSSSSL